MIFSIAFQQGPSIGLSPESGYCLYSLVAGGQPSNSSAQCSQTSWIVSRKICYLAPDPGFALTMPGFSLRQLLPCIVGCCLTMPWLAQQASWEPLLLDCSIFPSPLFVLPNLWACYQKYLNNVTHCKEVLPSLLGEPSHTVPCAWPSGWSWFQGTLVGIYSSPWGHATLPSRHRCSDGSWRWMQLSQCIVCNSWQGRLQFCATSNMLSRGTVCLPPVIRNMRREIFFRQSGFFCLRSGH